MGAASWEGMREIRLGLAVHAENGTSVDQPACVIPCFLGALLLMACKPRAHRQYKFFLCDMATFTFLQVLESARGTAGVIFSAAFVILGTPGDGSQWQAWKRRWEQL